MKAKIFVVNAKGRKGKPKSGWGVTIAHDGTTGGVSDLKGVHQRRKTLNVVYVNYAIKTIQLIFQ